MVENSDVCFTSLPHSAGQSESSVDNKVSNGVGFGKVISAHYRKERGLTRLPTINDILTPWSTYSLAKGDWMKLGDEMGEDIGSQIIGQQSNIALMAALLLTVQFAFMYGQPSLWGDLVGGSYLASFMDDGQIVIIHEAFMIATMTSITMNCMCMIYCCLVTLALGEVSSGAEVNFLSEILGKYLSGSLPLFVISIAIWALKDVFLQMFACSTLSGVVLTGSMAVLVTAFLLVNFFGRIVQALYQVKYMAGVPRPGAMSKELPLWSSPLFVAQGEIERWFKKFCEECGRRVFSPEHFLVYVTYAARGKAAGNSETADKLSPAQASAIAVAELCETSRLMVQRFAEEKMEEIIVEERTTMGKFAEPGGLALLDWIRSKLPDTSHHEQRSLLLALTNADVTVAALPRLQQSDMARLELSVGLRVRLEAALWPSEDLGVQAGAGSREYV